MIPLVYVAIILFLSIIMYNLLIISETFYDVYFDQPEIPIYETRYIQPWWNSSPSTRNMSYDLRGDPYPIPREDFPFLMSTI